MQKSHPYPQRIAQCLEAPLFNPGGVEVLVLELIRGLYLQGIESLLVAPQELSDEQRKALPGVKGIFVWDYSIPAVKQSRQLAHWLKDHQADMAHFHLGGSYGWNARSWSACPITYTARAGIPCVTTNHGAFTVFDCVASYRPLWVKLLSLPPFWLAKIRQLRHVRWEATVSQHDMRAVKKWFFPEKKKFVQLYHSRLKGDEFDSPKQSSDPVIPDTPFILCLGTIGARKGQQFLLEAFLQISHKFPEWKLVLAGRQVHEPTMRLIWGLLKSSDQSHRVLLWNDVDDETARALLQRAELFAIPSTAEGLGLSLQEAMYAGCACIGSRIGGIPDLIQSGKTGLLITPADVGALVDGLKSLMGNKPLRKQLGNAARTVMQKRGMTGKDMTDSYIKLYGEGFEYFNA